MPTMAARNLAQRVKGAFLDERAQLIKSIQAYVQLGVGPIRQQKQIARSTTTTEDGCSSTAHESEDGDGDEAEDAPLWRHPCPQDTYMWDFLQRVNSKYGKTLATYAELHRWSIDNTTQFWGEVWDHCGVRHSRAYEEVIEDASRMWPRPSWFSGARMNFAENLLFPTRDVAEDDVAVIGVAETGREALTWAELRERVRQFQASLRALDLQTGDRVAGHVANHGNALVAMLATVSLGGIWTAVSPDTGVTATLDRLVQIAPRVLLADNAVMYNGETHRVVPKLARIVAALPSLSAAVVLPTMPSSADVMEPERELDGCDRLETQILSLRTFLDLGEASSPLAFPQLPAEQPVFVLYSSGTTGAPKCIVHGAIGTLLQHKKEHILQSDMRPGDRLLYMTTCMWMMWHWSVSGLASGVTVILYNGSPFYYLEDDASSSSSSSSSPSPQASVKDDLAMAKLVDELRITHFGASAKYFSMLQQERLMPKEHGLGLESLRAIYSTGSPLAPSTFSYIYEAFGSINLGSISGGTDIIANFGTPSPLSPVYAGEIQALGLGMAVRSLVSPGGAFGASGEGGEGELVCVKPFPSQPVRFWGSHGQTLYQASYFERRPGIWSHGDLIRINPQTGGLVMLGRSDGVLNPSGVRFGSAEIYNLLLEHFPDTIEDALCVGRRRSTDMDETVVLFVKMRGGARFTELVAAELRRVVREELSPRHVPGVVEECPCIPVTANGKKMEVLVKRILCGGGAGRAGAEASGGVDGASVEWFRAWAGRN